MPPSKVLSGLNEIRQQVVVAKCHLTIVGSGGFDGLDDEFVASVLAQWHLGVDAVA
jgi:hypothetical protein